MSTAVTRLHAVADLPAHPVIYCRESKDAAAKGMHVKRQEAEARALCRRLGWGEPDVIVDNDISASRFSRRSRPGYERLKEGLRDGTWDGLAAMDADRLYRQLSDLGELVSIIRDELGGLPVETVQSGYIDLSSADGLMQAEIKASVSAHESNKKSERLKAQRRQAAASGAWQGGRRPYGFMANGVDHHPTEAPALVQAVEDLLDGASVNSVAKRLGLSRSVLRVIVTGPRIAGLRQHGGEIVGDAAWEPIIDRGKWEQLRAVLADPARRTTRPGRVNLLAGMVVSVDRPTADGGTVVAKMTTRSDRRHGRRYSTRQGVSPSCSIDSAKLEAVVVEGLLRWSDRIRPRSVEFDRDADLVSLEIARRERELADLIELRKAERITLVEYVALRDDVVAKLDRAKAAMPMRRVPTAAQQFFTVPGAWRTEWDAAEGDFARRRTLIASVVERVEITPGRQGAAFDTERIHVVQRTP